MGHLVNEPHSLRGIMIGLVLVARPAMASADLGVGTEVGAGWSEQRVDKVS